MRKVLSLVLLIVIAAGVWFGGRWFARRGEVKATIVLDRAGSLRPGDPVVEGEQPVGRVVRIDRMDDRDAVTVRLFREHRRSIVTDSLFAVDGKRLLVTNTFAVGRPVDDGAILQPRQDAITTFLVKHGGAVKPYLDRARARADEVIDSDFEKLSASLPSWKAEGQQALERHIAEARAAVDRTAAELTRSNRAGEARKLKERFEQWVRNARK